MKVETSKVTKLLITNIERLDPITVFLEDFGPGQGKVVIECFGKSWSAYWGAMGVTISEFILSADEFYIAGKLSSIEETVPGDTAAIVDASKRKLEQLIDDGEIDAELKPHYLSQIEALDEDYLAEFSNILEILFGPGWRFELPEMDNPDHVYLRKIINAVKDAIRNVIGVES